MMEPTAEPEQELILCSVSLAQYAGVQAGLAEGHELDAILAREGVSPETWEAADCAWSARLVHDLENDGMLQEAFDSHFLDAQDRHGRRISPLDDDLSAWLGFVRRWSSDREPVALLRRLGLQPCDVIRLHRAWSRRLARDPALRERAQELLQAAPAELPPMEAEPVAASSPPRAEAAVTEGTALPDALQSDPAGEHAPELFTALPHEEAEHAVKVERREGRAQTDTAEPTPDAVALAPVLPSFVLVGDATTSPMPTFSPGPALPFAAASTPAAEIAPDSPRSPAALEFRSDTVPVFGPPPPAQLALGPLSEAALPARAPEPSLSAGSAPKKRRGIFSLEQYAALCAEVAVFPEGAEKAFARYGLALERKRTSTDLRWKNRLRQYPAEHEEWERLYLRYYALFLEEARSGGER